MSLWAKETSTENGRPHDEDPLENSPTLSGRQSFLHETWMIDIQYFDDSRLPLYHCELRKVGYIESPSTHPPYCTVYRFQPGEAYQSPVAIYGHPMRYDVPARVTSDAEPGITHVDQSTTIEKHLAISGLIRAYQTRGMCQILTEGLDKFT